MAASSVSRRVVSILTNETTLYIVKRLGQAIITLLLASVLCFFVMQLAPGSFLDTLKENPKISPQRIAEYKERFGLDKSAIEQYFLWLMRIVTQGDFGQSFVYERPVVTLLWERVPATLLLSISSLVLTWALGIPLGIWAAVKRSQLADKVLSTLSYLGQGLPSIISGLLLLAFAQATSPLFPVGDMTSIDHEELGFFGKVLDIGWHLILPTIALSITGIAGLQRLMRGEMLDVKRQDYIQTARAKGLPEMRVIMTHAFRNALNPMITLLGFEFASLLGGAFITENLFNWPGLGRLILQALQAKDTYMVMASLMMGAAMLILGNLLADILLKFVDPRIQLGEDG
ncbi:MAG: ABC transporter permease [Cyanobacteria bacterium]|nr:ABC transporter permease [Cyanobacteriota bacterium]